MGKIVAYLSHSYRPQDRAINMAVWRRLNDAGVVFAVDPPSADKRPMDVTFLERMMQRSHCFVAIVPIRSRQTDGSSSTWSPYQEFECRLAIRANKPRMIVVEKDIDLGPLPEREPYLWFERSSLELDPDFDTEMKKFVGYARTREREYGVLPKTGVLRWTPADARWQQLTDALQARLPKKSIEIVDASEHTDDHLLLDQARNLSVLVADINPLINPGFLLGLLHGAAIPVFRTCLLAEAESESAKIEEMGLAYGPNAGPGRAADQLRLPLLFRGYQVDSRVRPITFWKESLIDDAVRTIAEATEAYRTRERRLETQSNGSKYFLSLQGNRIFISTPKDFNQITEPLKKDLEDAGMPAFHYQVPDADIPVGGLWQQRLQELITGADLLLAFISPSYWDSEQCRYEMREAVKRWERHQLLITVCAPETMPPMPGFLGRYQAMRLKSGVDERAAIVAVARDRFADAGQGDSGLVGGRFAQLLERHFDADTQEDVQAFLEKTGGLSQADAAATAAHVLASARPAAELTNVLVRGLQIEKFGPGALGRVCFYLRRLEKDRATRDWLTSQFSLLRLFPNLHDIDAWNRRRRRKQAEMRIAPDLPRASFQVLTALAGESAQALTAVARTGSDIAKQMRFEEPAAVLVPECRVAVVSEINDLMIPVEWAMLPELPEHLARIRPVFREVPNSTGGTQRESIEDLFERAAGAPPRTLLFGYGPPDLPNVTKELNEIKGVFDRQYQDREWPLGLTELVPADQATGQGLYARLANSDYDILHVSGHAGWNGNSPAIRVAAADGHGEWVSGSELGQWLRDSSVKFVYLSCCGGAAAPLTREPAEWRHSLCREVLQAGVPEVAAYFWPVSDERSVPFVRRFYEQFLKEFDAPQAMFLARQSCETGNPLWAGSVIIRQTAGAKQ